MADQLNQANRPESRAPQAFTIGVLSDTHVPDRRRQLDPRIRVAFQQAGVDLILHAGDIATQTVLDQLAEIAPVRAVRGNRDWMMLRHLPSSLTMEINGVSLVLTHGHGRLIDYLRDRVDFYRHGFQIDRYMPRLLSSFPNSKLIVFGHIHRPLTYTSNGQTLFNPGSAHVPDPPYQPSLGFIRISTLGELQTNVIQLAEIAPA